MTLQEFHEKVTKQDHHKKVTITMDMIEWISITNIMFDGAEKLKNEGLYFSAKDALDDREKILNAVKNQIELTW